jgi:hypothetical protein
MKIPGNENQSKEMEKISIRAQDKDQWYLDD